MENISKIAQKVGRVNIHAVKLQEHLTNILEDSRDLLYKYNFQTEQYEYLSKSVESFTGYSRQEVLDRGADLLLENLHPDDKDEFMRLLLALKNNTFEDSEFTHEYRYRHKDGRYLWRSDSINILRAENGEIISIFGSTRDITSQKNLQQRLIENEKRYKELYQNAKVALYRTRINDGIILECNQALVELLGYDSLDECLFNHSLADRYTNPKNRAELLDILQKNKQIHHFETQMKRLDGTLKWVKIAAVLSPDAGYLEGAMCDITASKILTKAEKKVLAIVLQGKSNKEIAHILHRSVRTIEDHRAHIMQKLDATNLVELTQKAFKLGVETTNH